MKELKLLIVTSWVKLTQREQLLLKCFAFFFVVMMSYLIVWKNLDQAITEHNSSINRELLNWEWIKRSVLQIQDNNKLPVKTQQHDVQADEFLSVMNQTIKQSRFQIEPTISELTGGNIQVTFSKVAFNQYIQWLMYISQHYNIKIITAQMYAAKEPGYLQADITVSL